MKYYSELTNKIYNTKEECEADEEKRTKSNADAEHLKQEIVETEKAINELTKKLLSLKREFREKYDDLYKDEFKVLFKKNPLNNWIDFYF